MSRVGANCPSCGGPVEWKVGSSVVTVCPYCRAVCARGDRGVENLGRVAEVVETGHLLALGQQGKYEGVSFELVGRTQLRHQAGGVWDEWYAHFRDGRWGWVAEAQGRFYVTFRDPPPSGGSGAGGSLPGYDDLQVGGDAGVGGLVVAEKGTAKPAAAEGEIPYRLTPEDAYAYADLSGPGGAFGTLDYGDDPPALYRGREVPLSELHIPEKQLRQGGAVRQVAAEGVSCPDCGGPLSLKAPDKTERVGCPYCGSLLDVNRGNLTFLKALEGGKVEPLIPLGSVGTFPEGKLTVIGFMQRAVTVEGIDYFWTEYLLYEPRVGFRWLVHGGTNHWNTVRPLPPGEVRGYSKSARYGGKTYRLFDRGEARVTYVVGEFYWRVEVGERVDTADFVRPPEVLSRESGALGEGQAEEMNWSLGTYVTPDEVKAAFGRAEPLPTPTGVYLNQPFGVKGVYRNWALLTAVTLLLGFAFTLGRAGERHLEERFPLEVGKPGDPLPVLFSKPFELRGWRNVRVRVDSTAGGVYFDGDLVSEATQTVWPFAVVVPPGGGRGEAVLSAVPAGSYTVRLEADRQDPNAAGQVTVRVDQNVARAGMLVWALVLMAVPPVLVALWQASFESRRWSESPFGSS